MAGSHPRPSAPDDNPLQGRPLPRRAAMPSRPTVAGYALAAHGGPRFARRLVDLEHELTRHERGLAQAWRALAVACAGDPERFARRWRRTATDWRFDDANRLVDDHNRFYPIEARLPLDPRTGDYVPVHGRCYRRERLDAGWVLARFPPLLPLAGSVDAAARGLSTRGSSAVTAPGQAIG